MKINFILPHYGLKPSGGFKIVYQYANYLSKNGHNVNIIHVSSFNNGIKRKLKFILESYKLRTFEPWFNLDKKINIIYLENLEQEKIPDADAIIFTAWQTAYFGKDFSESKGVKFYLIQSYEIWNGPKELVNETLKYKMFKMVISKQLVDITKNLGVYDVIYIPNFVDLSMFKVIKAIDDRKKTISIMYSPVENKGFNYGFSVIKDILSYRDDFDIVVFGKYSRPKELDENIIYYENPKQNVLVEKIYNGSTIFICTSLHEGWGLPVMEAMACGCAVVSFDNGGINNFAINKKNSLIVPVKDTNSLKKSIIKLMDDDFERIRLANNAVEDVKQFDQNNSMRLFESIIANNVKEKK